MCDAALRVRVPVPTEGRAACAGDRFRGCWSSALGFTQPTGDPLHARWASLPALIGGWRGGEAGRPWQLGPPGQTRVVSHGLCRAGWPAPHQQHHCGPAARVQAPASARGAGQPGRHVACAARMPLRAQRELDGVAPRRQERSSRPVRNHATRLTAVGRAAVHATPGQPVPPPPHTHALRHEGCALSAVACLLGRGRWLFAG